MRRRYMLIIRREHKITDIKKFWTKRGGKGWASHAIAEWMLWYWNHPNASASLSIELWWLSNSGWVCVNQKGHHDYLNELIRDAKALDPDAWSR